MLSKKISAATVTYFSDLTLVETLLSSVKAAVDKMFIEHQYRCEYFIIDSSHDDYYFWRLETVCNNFFDTDCLSIHIIKASKNVGFSAGNNLVLSKLDSEFHLVINPDVAVELVSFCRAIEYLEENSDVAVVSPRIMDAGFEFGHVIKTYPDYFTLFLRYAEIPLLTKRFTSRLERYACCDLREKSCKDVKLAGGCFLFTRTSLFKKLNGFDEAFFVYFEDFDYSIRAAKYTKIAYVPEIRIKHLGGYVGRKGPRHHWLFFISSIKFFKRHGWKLF